MKLEKIKKEVINFLFPLECLGCGEENTWLCQKCFNSITFKTEQSCVFCRRPSVNGKTCQACALKHSLDQCLSAGYYNDPLLSGLIKAYKYSFAKELVPLLSQFIISFLEKNFPDQDSPFKEKNILLIPIPLHKKRLNWRGFNQSELLAKELKENFNLELSLGLLRLKNNTPQAKLKEEKRRLNISDVFCWVEDKINDKNIILIDDVATTGTTLDEATKVLKKYGAKKVTAITVAGGEKVNI